MTTFPTESSNSCEFKNIDKEDLSIYMWTDMNGPGIVAEVIVRVGQPRLRDILVKVIRPEGKFPYVGRPPYGWWGAPKRLQSLIRRFVVDNYLENIGETRESLLERIECSAALKVDAGKHHQN